MPAALPELTQKRIIRTYETTSKSQQAIADEYGVSLATVKRLTKGRSRTSGENAETKMMVAQSAIAQGATVVIDGLDVTEVLKTAIADVSAGMVTAKVNSKEGAAGALARLVSAYRSEMPKSLEAIVDLLLTHPDFEPTAFVKLLKERYARRQAS
jgi:predicted transcriptional regulator